MEADCLGTCITTPIQIPSSGMTCSGPWNPDVNFYYCCDNTYPDYANIICVENNSNSTIYFDIEVVGV
ncbi:MAG: hypothetical protein KJN66_05945 [Bacteroidia bacterium]|nr:hypothetical protein [Bacteroidia bacterium]